MMGSLRQWFGPSKEEVWRQLSSEMGADFVDQGCWKGQKVQAHRGQWTVTLDTFTVSTGKTHATFTRMRAPYVNPDGFRFTIYRKSIFSGIGKFLGMQDIEIGDPRFDEAFIIKGTDETRLRMLFSSDRVKELLDAQPEVYFQVRNDEGWFGPQFPEGVDELYFQVSGVVKDIDRLKALFDLFAEVLNQLCRIGSAYEDNPQVTL